jgi:hypothetical protein
MLQLLATAKCYNAGLKQNDKMTRRLTAATPCNMSQWRTTANCYNAGLQQNVAMADSNKSFDG